MTAAHVHAARPYVLAETSWGLVKDRPWDIAVLPWGATEAHNYHLPYGTDCYQVEAVGTRAVETCWNAGVRAMLLPTIPFGVNAAQLDMPFHINMNPSTQWLVLRDIVTSLERQNVKRLLILNGHGANNFSGMIRELYGCSAMLVAAANWFAAVPSKEFFEAPGDHADELETSVMLAVCPHLVRPLSEAGRGHTKPMPSELLQQGWAWTQRGWLNKTTMDAGAGDPVAATAAKGEAFMHAVVAKVARLICDLAMMERDEF